MMTRGIRNNNPGNIKDFGIPWNGIADKDVRSPQQLAEETFVVFRGPWWGIRAIARTILTYSRKYGIKTPAGIIARWAPGSDSNPTDQYAKYVADRLNVKVNQVIDVEDYETMRELLRAIVKFENGVDPYTWEYDTGLILADIEPKQQTSPA